MDQSSTVYIGKYEIKMDRGVSWLKIFFHNCTGSIWFQNESEALFSNTEQKYSILGLINNEMRINGRFEFLLEYPEIGKSNQWVQLNNPVYEIENTTSSHYNVSGYEPINIQMSNANWGGLVKSLSFKYSFIEGSVGHSDWFYGIGVYSPAYGPNKIPANQGVNYVYLWIRISDTSIFFSNKKCSYNKFFIHFFFSYILLFLFS